jgi:hypothetical protein
LDIDEMHQDTVFCCSVVRFSVRLSLNPLTGGLWEAASDVLGRLILGGPAMKRKSWKLAMLTFLAAACTLTGTVTANETATIRNESTHVVPIVLKWSHLPVASGVILLAPGQAYKTSGPDGQSLFIAFNATPTNTQFPRIVNYQAITGFTANPLDLGVVSVFRNVTPLEVNLVLP